MNARNAALKAAAKTRVPPMGVYALRNLASGECHLGSSLNLTAVLNRHRFALGMGSHPDKALQAAWHRDGAASFAFEILDRLAPRDEPAQDYKAELETMLALWIAELDGRVAGTLA